jgi:NAD(P)-dependent dehydrogenase (short-subunit alcohol dehydrogenase family)
MDFTRKTCLVTGAVGNAGRALVSAFADRGANCVITARHRGDLESLYGEEHERRLLVAADLLDQAQVDAMVTTALSRYGRIDVLCNVAGGFRMGEAVHQTSDANWQFLFDINDRTLLNAVRAVVPVMLAAGGGKIVNIGAFGALRGTARMGAYVASKSAVIRLTESMSAELRDKNINVNCVLPTTIDTPENRAAMPDADPTRWVAPSDLAKVILFLASDDARAIHGAALPVTALS